MSKTRLPYKTLHNIRLLDEFGRLIPNDIKFVQERLVEGAAIDVSTILEAGERATTYSVDILDPKTMKI